MADTPPPAPLPASDAPPHGGWQRRDVLRATAVAGLAASVAGFWLDGFGDPLRRRRLEPTPAGGPGVTFDAAAWSTLEAVLSRLIPSEPTAPGAREVNAVGYLDRVLQEPDLDPARFRDVVLAGVPTLEARARTHGGKGFAALAPEAQDAVLHGLEADATGVAWLKKLLYFGLEALLGDPVHGCQPGEVGWTWLQHALPEPRPRTPGWKPVGR